MDVVRIYFELLNLAPLPFKVALFVFFTSFLLLLIARLAKILLVIISKAGIRVAEWITRMLLLPEFLLMRVLRLINIQYAPGAGIYDDIVQFIGKSLHAFFDFFVKMEKKEIRYPRGLVFLLMVVISAVWYLVFLPELNGSLTQDYVLGFFSWYIDMEAWAFSLPR